MTKNILALFNNSTCISQVEHNRKDIIIKTIVFVVFMIIVLLSIKHSAKNSTLKNVLFFCGLTGVFMYYYITRFLTEQIQQLTYKKLSILTLTSIICSIDISSTYHYHYVPYVILCFMIPFFIMSYLLTLDITHMKYTSLSDAYNPHNNSFTLVRFILASVVLAGHFGMHGGSGPFISRGLRYNFFNAFWYEGNVAVYLFFVISGFFMIQSLANSNNSTEYLTKRILRIFPLFILLSFIALIGTHNIHNFLQALTLNAFGGTLNYNPNYEPTGHLDFNSSWTLKNEFICYLLLLVIYKVVTTKRLYFLLITILFVVLDLLYYVKTGGRGYLAVTIFANSPLNFDLVSFLPLFLVSSSIYLYKDRIPVNKHTILFAFFLLFIFMFFNIDIAKTLGLLIIIPYLLIAVCSKVKLQLWTKIGDYSYGIYLIHPIVYNNLGNYFFPHYQRTFTNLIIVYVITLILAIISWHVVEKPAMRLKRIFCK